jgi:nucleoside-diphosphate-sugar epimerase
MVMSKRTVLVTGGLGFIGWHCVNRWLKDDWRVIIVDNCSSNVVDPFDVFAACDVVANIADVSPYEFESLDLVLHLASPVGPVGVLQHAGRMGQMIMDDTMAVINIALEHGCPLVFVSTSEIYGHRNEKSYLVENDDKVLRGDYTVRNEYAVAKLLAEIVVTNHAAIHDKFRYQLIRPFNVACRLQGVDGGFCLPRFVTQAKSNKPLTVYGTGEQLRAFTWVEDIVEGVWLTANAPAEHWNKHWNIGNEANETSILSLAELVIERSGSSSIIDFVDPKVLHGDLFTEAPEKIPDSTRIRDDLGWFPTGSIDFVVDEVLDFYRHDAW